MMHEQRQHPRVPVSIDAHWHGPGAASLCKVADLSLSGCFARTPSPPALDAETLVTMFFGGRGAMLLQGHVVRVEPGVGFALQFGQMGSESRYQLGQEIAQVARKSASMRLKQASAVLS
jgi:hypothetical protein